MYWISLIIDSGVDFFTEFVEFFTELILDSTVLHIQTGVHMFIGDGGWCNDASSIDRIIFVQYAP